MSELSSTVEIESEMISELSREEETESGMTSELSRADGVEKMDDMSMQKEN